jgi:EAL domain-containing protein (putative c-di-GMP-specific phosphodiesterase class I)
VYNALLSSNISASGSLVIFPDDSEDSSELLRFADMAMHEAKRQGKGRIVRFNNEMQKSFTRKMKLESKLAEAVLSGDFQQYYQPQFYIKTGKLRGFEALIRWNDSENGNIPPSEFIPIAEECGLIIPIGKWVLRTAFTELKRWQTEYGFTGIMSVNVSPLQMKQENFVSELADMISSFDIDPDTIEIEITEGVMIDNMHVAVETLAFLKQMGLRVSLDDFGTGYSSLSYLQMLPLDTLKIDKSFINNITDSSGIQANITNSIISMVSKMGLSTIAEGVEAPEQLELLERLNCSIVQGFLRGKPMPARQCEAYLSGDESALETNEEAASEPGSRYSTYRTQPV